MKEITSVRAAEQDDIARHEERQRRAREHHFFEAPWSHRDLV